MERVIILKSSGERLTFFQKNTLQVRRGGKITGDQYIGEKFILATEMVVIQARLCTNPIWGKIFQWWVQIFFFSKFFLSFWCGQVHSYCSVYTPENRKILLYLFYVLVGWIREDIATSLHPAVNYVQLHHLRSNINTTNPYNYSRYN